MRILFTMLLYNDIREGLGFYSNFTTEVSKLGHDVTVIAPSLNGKTELRMEGDISVLRVTTGKLFNVHPIVKGISNLRLPAAFQKAMDRHIPSREFDWVVSPTPPITLAPLIQKLKSRFNCPSYLILRDIFPQNARDLELINNSLIFNFFRRKEKKLYGISNLIGCMSRGNIEYVKKHNPELEPDKLGILYNWINTQGLQESKDADSVKQNWNLGGKFIALFGGNFGKPQKIESILELAESVKESHPDICFLLIGDGTERERVEQMVSVRQLSNVVLKKRLSQEEYLRLASACDVGMVNLSDKFTIPNIPSRTWAYWAAKLPVLACVDKNTDLDKIVDEVKGGLCSITGDLKTYRENLLKLFDDRGARIQMGQNGLEAVRSMFCTKVIAKEFIAQLESFKSRRSPKEAS